MASSENNRFERKEDLIEFLKRKNKKSYELYKKACESIPNGVTSRGRFFPPFPFLVEKAKGSKIIDIDGNEYIDCAM